MLDDPATCCALLRGILNRAKIKEASAEWFFQEEPGLVYRIKMRADIPMADIQYDDVVFAQVIMRPDKCEIALSSDASHEWEVTWANPDSLNIIHAYVQELVANAVTHRDRTMQNMKGAAEARHDAV